MILISEIWLAQTLGSFVTIAAANAGLLIAECQGKQHALLRVARYENMLGGKAYDFLNVQLSSSALRAFAASSVL